MRRLVRELGARLDGEWGEDDSPTLWAGLTLAVLLVGGIVAVVELT